jgi:hypothetical protein
MANALDTSIILSGRQPDIVATLTNAAQGGQAARQFKQRNALDSYLQGRGTEVMRGDPQAMNALAQFGVQGVEFGQGVQANNLNMQNTQQTMQARTQAMGIQSAQEQRAAETQIAAMSKVEREEIAAGLEMAISRGMAAQTPEEWDQLAGEVMPELIGQFGNRDALINQAIGTVEALKRQDKMDGVGGDDTSYGLTPRMGVDENGKVVAIQFASDGTARQTVLPEGVTISPGIKQMDLGNGYQNINTETGEPVGPFVPKNFTQKILEESEATRAAEARADLAVIETGMPQLREMVADLNMLSTTATSTTYGRTRDDVSRRLGLPTSDAAIDSRTYMATLDNEILPLLRQTFGAAFTAAEGDRLRATLGGEELSPAEKQATLDAFITAKERRIKSLQGAAELRPQTAGATPPPAAATPPAAPTEAPSAAQFRTMPQGDLNAFVLANPDLSFLTDEQFRELDARLNNQGGMQ